MIDYRTGSSRSSRSSVEPCAALLATKAELHARGFSPPQVERLAGLMQRHERGEFRELSGTLSRVLFACWLLDHDRLGDDAGATGRGTDERPVG